MKKPAFLFFTLFFFTQGGKTEPLFLLASLPFFVYLLRAEIPLHPFLLFIAAIVWNIWGSLNASAGVFGYAQWLMAGLSFFLFKSWSTSNQDDGFFDFLLLAGLLTGAVTAYQWLMGTNQADF